MEMEKCNAFVLGRRTNLCLEIGLKMDHLVSIMSQHSWIQKGSHILKFPSTISPARAGVSVRHTLISISHSSGWEDHRGSKFICLLTNVRVLLLILPTSFFLSFWLVKERSRGQKENHGCRFYKESFRAKKKVLILLLINYEVKKFFGLYRVF